MELSYPDPELTDGVVLLRPWRDDDVDCVREAATDPRIPAGTTVPAVFDVGRGLAFLARQRRRIEDGEGLSLAITDVVTGAARGLLWLPVRSQPGVLGLGYWMVPAARGRGLGTRAVRLAAAWALGPLGAARVEAWVEPGNAASQHLVAAAGFTHEGVLRSFLAVAGGRSDAWVYSRTADDPWLTPGAATHDTRAAHPDHRDRRADDG